MIMMMPEKKANAIRKSKIVVALLPQERPLENGSF